MIPKGPNVNIPPALYQQLAYPFAYSQSDTKALATIAGCLVYGFMIDIPIIAFSVFIARPLVRQKHLYSLVMMIHLPSRCSQNHIFSYFTHSIISLTFILGNATIPNRTYTSP
ncbi:MAG: hypothetical protein ABGF52_03845 [Candidatus Asgardarchaeum sp.]